MYLQKSLKSLCFKAFQTCRALPNVDKSEGEGGFCLQINVFVAAVWQNHLKGTGQYANKIFYSNL